MHSIKNYITIVLSPVSINIYIDNRFNCCFSTLNNFQTPCTILFYYKKVKRPKTNAVK